MRVQKGAGRVDVQSPAQRGGQDTEDRCQKEEGDDFIRKGR